MSRTPAQEFVHELQASIPHLTKLASTLARQASDAADLLQDTCRRAIESREQFRPNTDLLAWLRRILINLHIDALRRTRFEVFLGDGADEIAAAVPSPPPRSRIVSTTKVQRAVESLPEPYREAYVLFTRDRLRYVEIARRLCVSIGTVGTRIHRARRLLRDQLLEHSTGNEPAPAEGISTTTQNAPMCSPPRRTGAETVFCGRTE